MESETASSKQYGEGGMSGEREATTDTDRSATTGAGTSTKVDDSASFTLRGIMLHPGAFGEGGPSSLSMDYKRQKKTIGYLSKSRFGKFDNDIKRAQQNPYLLELRSLYLTDLTNVEQFAHITYLDLTYNKITNAGLAILSKLVHLVTLILDHNKVRSITLPKMRNLMYLSLNKNLISIMSFINQLNLQFLFLNENRIRFVRYVDSMSVPKLNTLSISHCQLYSMSTNYSQTLEKLFLTYNRISNIQGLAGLVNLKWLHLRGNRIKKLTGFSEELKKLYYVNLRENDIEEEQQLKFLKKLPMLRILILTGNPLNDEENIRQNILVHSPDMRRINKYLVEDEEADDARRLIAEFEEQEREAAKLKEIAGEGGVRGGGG